MWKKLILTPENDVAATVLRLTLGIVMFPHGAQKALGWFGGQGFSATLQGFQQHMGIPMPLAFLVIVAEFLGAIALVIGLFTRVAAFGIAMIMLVAALMVHRTHGFFMNWMGNQAGEGIEYHLLALGIAIALMIRGGGAVSADSKLARRL